MRILRLVGTVLAFGLLLSPTLVVAGEEKGSADLLTPYGMSFSVGGGVTGFTNEDLRDFAQIGGTWEARLAAGTRRAIGFEAAYLGGAQGMDVLGLDKDAILLATGLEGNVRVNLLEGAVQPYILAGAGWKHYQLTRADFNTSSVNDSDDVLEIPLGAGVGYRYERILIDARAVFRPAVGGDLVGTPASGGETAMHNWMGRVNVGFEF